MKYLNDISKDCVGKVCKSNLSGDFKIVKYNNKRTVEIQFLNTGFKAVVELGSIRKGEVKDRYSPSVFGVGIIGAKYPVSEGGIHTKDYVLWKSMLQRCYSTVYKKKYPTYEGCEVSDNFKSYEYFYEWCQEQIGFNNDDWQLDKDLLIKGNKVYSESTCVFLPKGLNNLLVKSDGSRGELPIGVCYHKRDKSFMSRVSLNNGYQKHLGSFNSEIEAFNAYKTSKESYIKELAEKYKHQIDERAYQVLLDYQVEIDD